MLKHIAPILLSLFISIQAYTQPDILVQLIDQSNNLPIAGANYVQGVLHGTSDENGYISLETSQVNTLQISHVSYGAWEVSGKVLESAIRTGYIYRENISVNLYPVSIIAIHRKQNEIGTIDLNYEDHLAHDGADLLLQESSVSAIRKSGGYGFDPVLRGFKYDQLNIVLNGAQGACAACPNRMDPPSSQMAPNMIDRIEILKGPFALRYGNAIGATINYVSSPLSFTEKMESYGRISGGYESNGSIKRSEALIGLKGKQYNLGVFASWSDGDDYTSGDMSLVQSEFMRGSMGMNAGIQLNSKQQIKVSATRNIARNSEFVALPMDLRNDDTWLLNARHDLVLEGRNLQSVNTTLFASFVDHEMDNYDKVINPRTVDAITLANTKNYGGRTEGMWKFAQHLIYTGADLKIEGAEGTRTRDFLMGPMAGNSVNDNVWQNSEIMKSALFGEWHSKLSAYQFILAGRIEYNNARSLDPDQRFLDTHPETNSIQINPGISFGALTQFGEHVNLSFWLGRVQRSGSLTERYINYFPVGLDPYEMIGNPQINPEINNEGDLSLRWESKKSRLELNVFLSYLQDYISSRIDESLTPRMPSSPGVRVFSNIEAALKSGFELSWHQEITSFLTNSLSLAYTKGDDLGTNQALPEIAPMDIRYRLFASFLDSKLLPEVSFRRVWRQARISEEFGESESPAFSLLDLKMAYRINPMIKISSGLKNVFDVAYYEHLSRSVRGSLDPIYARGRSFNLTFNLEF